MAVKSGHNKIVEMLLEKDIDLTIKDANGLSIMELCIDNSTKTII